MIHSYLTRRLPKGSYDDKYSDYIEWIAESGRKERSLIGYGNLLTLTTAELVERVPQLGVLGYESTWEVIDYFKVRAIDGVHDFTDADYYYTAEAECVKVDELSFEFQYPNSSSDSTRWTYDRKTKTLDLVLKYHPPIYFDNVRINPTEDIPTINFTVQLDGKVIGSSLVQSLTLCIAL